MEEKEGGGEAAGMSNGEDLFVVYGARMAFAVKMDGSTTLYSFMPTASCTIA